MNYRITKCGTKWQAEVIGRYNEIPICDENGDECLFNTEEDARCEMQRRIVQYGTPPAKRKEKQMCATEVT